MARYKMDDGTVIDTDNAQQDWEENTWFDGHNHVSVSTGSQWTHQRLYKSRKGRYYIEHTSQWQGNTPHAEWVSPQEATRWLLMNNHEIPADLAAHVDDMTE